MITLYESINVMTDDFRERVQDLLENTEGVQNVTTETLARWISEEFSKFLVDYRDDTPEEEDRDYFDDRNDEFGHWDSRE